MKGAEWFWLAVGVIGFGLTAANGGIDHYARIALLISWAIGLLWQIYILATWKKRNANRA